ncbi:hypothetical protein R3P38DRAFT_2802175 [Favolaschia claudopus]|uniref:CCHC-type domain-containing protein n=1 Tax=Favolaschia claudopus TaxID=2862362 RepID=A0AAV9ZV23_9AGAR
MHISRLLCAPLPEQAATRGTSEDLQLQAIPDAWQSVKSRRFHATRVTLRSEWWRSRRVFYFLGRLFPVSTLPLAFARLQKSDAQTGTSACYSVLIPEAYHADLDNSYGDSKSSQEEGSTKTVRCGFCKKRGHYRKTCPVALASTPVYYPAKAKVDLPTCGVQIEAYAEEKATTARPAPIVVREGSRGQTRRMKGLKEGAADDHIEGSRVR